MNPQPDPTDADLAVRASAGDERAFTTLMRRHKDPLYQFVRRYVGDSDEAYDLLQESFAAAWRALRRYDPQRPFPIWLRSIALNKCRDWTRRRSVRRWLTHSDSLDSPPGQAIADDARSPEGAASDRQVLRRLDQAISSLPRGLKEPLILTAVDELSHEEAGRLLGLSAKAIELRVYRARRTLAEMLERTRSA